MRSSVLALRRTCCCFAVSGGDSTPWPELNNQHRRCRPSEGGRVPGRFGPGIVFIRPDESDGLDGVRRAGGPWGRRARNGSFCGSTRTTSRSPSRTSCSGFRKSNDRIPISTCFSMGTSTRCARVRGTKPGRSRRRSRARRKPENRTLLAGARIAAPMAMRKPTKKELTSVPIEHLDLEKTTSVADLVDGYKRISFQARTLGMCASVLENAMTDPQCTVFFGGAGALTLGGLRKVMRDMVEFGLVDVVVTTGAIAYHDYYEAHGHRHYATTPETDDIVLREHFLDRVYDTLADESLFRECDDEIAGLADGLETRPYSSREFLWEMGKIAAKDPQSLVGTCYRKGIPYFVPALNDSSIGIALAKHHHDRVKAKKTPIAIDSIKDNYEIAQVKLKSPRTGVFYVGGGTPKNYISQVEVIQEVMGYPENPHMYAAQITVEVPQWGGLSGCTFEESQSWGKFHKDAKMAQSLVDATIGLPLLIA